jgi:regulatory protein
MDAYTTALALLSRRELSTAQLRTRLLRRKCDADDIDNAIRRLAQDGTLDDRRVAMAVARVEGAVRHRGRRRALQRVQQLGVSAGVAEAAVNDVFGDLDEGALLDRAIDKRLKGASPRTLDAKAVARLVRGVVGQGFDAGTIYARLRARGRPSDDE